MWRAIEPVTLAGGLSCPRFCGSGSGPRCGGGHAVGACQGQGVPRSHILTDGLKVNKSFRAKPELVCLDEFSAGSLLPGGRLDLRVAVLGYCHSGFAINRMASRISQRQSPGRMKRRTACFSWVHITLSNQKRILLGTHHKVEQKHLKRSVA